MKPSQDSIIGSGTNSTHNHPTIPNLRFPDLDRGRLETELDLSLLLYFGGSTPPIKNKAREIALGNFGQPQYERLDLVTKIHETISYDLVKGGSHYTTRNKCRFVRQMFAWAEHNDAPLTTESIEGTFLRWTESMIVDYQIFQLYSQRSAYTYASTTAQVIDQVLNRPTKLIHISRIRMPPTRKSAVGKKAEKQNLENTFEFGAFLQDICDALTVQVAMTGPLPIHIPLRRGGELIEWSHCLGAVIEKHLTTPQPTDPKGIKARETCIKKFRERETDHTLKTRYPLTNRRIEAELLMFMGQTGMNFAQTHKLKMRQFSYSSHLDGYVVRDWKARRKGEVLFEIFKEYKPHFERYLDWRNEIFPDSDEVFPLFRLNDRAPSQHPQFRLRKACKEIGLKFVPPAMLRNTRVNWLLRKTGDPSLTASMAQHSIETLIRVYELPSQQRAMAEIIRFWSSHDPLMELTEPVAPGQCDGVPVQVENAPAASPKPDCAHPSGCMWCDHHRDVDSQDYLWSLACFRHLKIIEVSKWVTPGNGKGSLPNEMVIERISQKLKWFTESSKTQKKWVDEALARVEEGYYHPNWARRIAVMEGASR